MRFLPTLILTGLLCLLAAVGGEATAAPGDREPAGPGPLPDAWIAPADVTLCLHVEGAARLRADLARRPIARLVHDLVGDGDLADAWLNFARPAGLSEGALFDRLLGRRFSLFVRSTDEAGLDWAVVTQMDPAEAGEMFTRLAPRRLAPRWGLPMAELPEQELRVARDGPRYLLGPAAGSLFDEIVPRLAAGAPGIHDDPGLAAHPALVRSRTLGGGAAALFVRHDAPLDGWSVLVADVDGDKVAIRHRGSFEDPPFGRPVTEFNWDMSALDALEDAALFAIMEPTDIGGGQIGLFAQAALGAPFLDAAMRRLVGDSHIIAVGEVEGRLEAKPADMLVPSGAIAIRMKDDRIDPRECDATAARLAHAIERMQPKAAPLDVPGPEDCARGAARHVDLSSVMELFGEGHPILDAVSLNWGIARGPGGSYYVVATHPEHLARVMRAIENEPAAKARARFGRWASCGTLNGRRMGRHLRSYMDEVARLVTQDPGDAAAFRTTILNVSRLCDGMDRCRWQMRRPTVNDVTLDVQVELTAPESSGDE